jgi:hypothetical protein
MLRTALLFCPGSLFSRFLKQVHLLTTLSTELTGRLDLDVSFQPALQSGHMIVLNVDGENGESSSATSGLTMELKNMSRGLHTIIATVVDKDGNDLIKTEPVSFHVLRVGGG